MKIKCGIVGYGNLGKAIEKQVYTDNNFELVCVFSKRDIKAKFAKVDNVENIEKYKDKIDLLFLCGGSSSNLTAQAYECLKNFNTIDAYDNHKEIKDYVNSCNVIAKENSKVAFCCFGWDPGVFSLIRILLSSLKQKFYTIWGKGISQGHSEALRKINGVKNAVSYTIPNKKYIKCLKNNKVSNGFLHNRKCYIVSENKDKSNIKKAVLNHKYFQNCKVKFCFVNEKQFLKHSKLFHKGEIFTSNNSYNFKVKMQDNASFTANILVCYANMVYKFYKQSKFGAYTIGDIPINQLVQNPYQFI